MEIKEKKEPQWHSISFEETAEILKTDINHGLTQEEAEQRKEKFGPNKLPEEKPISRWKILMEQFQSPLIYILVIAGTITLFLKEWTDTIVIFASVFLNTIVGYIQEYKASNALRELKKVLRTKTNVLREGNLKEIYQENLVPGDIILLKAGDKVPADARIIESSNLKINEAALTGEWISADKKTDVLPETTPLADRDNMVYMGTIVETGKGKAIVTTTGKQTEIGKIAQLVKETQKEKTPYQKKLSRFSKIIGVIIVFLSLFIFIIGTAAGKNFTEMFVLSVAIAVSAIPEGLPVVMTVILALGMQRILKKGGLVRKLASAETLGSTSIIATDKTLTLTQGKMVVKEIKTYDEQTLFKIATLCNEAFIENPKALKPLLKIRGRPTDKALLIESRKKGFLKEELEKKLVKVDEIPFNAENKFIATLHQAVPQNLLFVSGAPEKILKLSSKIKLKRGEKRIGKKELQRLNKELHSLANKGLRVVALGYKRTKAKRIKKEDIKSLVFCGFIGLEDPLREEAKKAIEICQKAGMRPIIVTGDHILTAKAVGKKLNLKVGRENLLEGEELDKMSDEELKKSLEKITIFARVTPHHKMRIIRAWQEKNQVVAMTGDGINDAPALKKADIGVALGSGTEVAKEVADLVLLNDSFSIIVEAVEEGRAILENIRKAITYLLSGSFTEVILVATSIFFHTPLPITAVQILWINLIEDGLPNLALAFEPKEKDLMEEKPINHGVPLLTKEMKTIIFFIGIFTDLILVSFFFWLLKKSHDIGYIRTMIFVGLVIDSLFYIFSCKSLRKNIWHINIFSNKLLILAWVISVSALMGAIYIPLLQKLLGTHTLKITDWIILSFLGLINLAAIEMAKYHFIAKTKKRKRFFNFLIRNSE